ncbi:MAG: hypothetical protein Q8R04_00825 [Nanoarchaeota archaeon]|nr:hypothetical protein [Nanoarchaeota archaeon]
MNKLNIFVDNKSLIDKALNEVKVNYRPYDPGWYLYLKICKEKDIKNKFKDQFIELIYVTLSAWNMNSRGAKLAKFQEFKKSIIKNKKNIVALSKYRLDKLSNTEYDKVIKILEYLFYNLKLVGYNNNKKNSEKPRLVTFSKTIHFLLPNLVVPIDRKYTLNFFYNNASINNKLELQFQKFSYIFKECSSFALEVKLNSKVGNSWNQNIPKAIDNIIIGYSKLKGKL